MAATPDGLHTSPSGGDEPDEPLPASAGGGADTTGTPCAEDVEDAELEGDRPFAPGTARAALSYGGFRRVYAGFVSSNVGTWMQNVVLTQYAYALTESPTFVSIVIFAQLGPLLLFSLVGGSLADRFDRRRMLIAVSIQQALFAFVLAWVATDPDPDKAALVAVVFCIGVGQAVAGPTFSSALPTLVEKRDLSGAVSLISANLNFSRVLGAAIGPLVFATLGVAWVFAINGVTYFFIVAGVATVAFPPVAADPNAPSGWRRVLGGFAAARQDPVIARVLLTATTFSFFCLIFVAQMPTLANVNLGLPKESATYGWLYATFGTGALLGALSIGTVFAGRDLARIVRPALAAFAAVLAVFALVRSPGPAFPVAFVLGFAYFVVITSLSTILQERVDDSQRGRVMALWIMSFGGTVPIGNLFFGPIIEATSMTTVMLIGAVVAAGLVVFSRLEVPERTTEPAAT